MKSVSALSLLITFHVLRIKSQSYFSEELWIQPSPVDFGHLTLWQELRFESELDCVRKCYHAYCSGCGYQTDEGKCFMYLDWNNVTSWNPLSTGEYYLPAQGMVFEEWSDMRKYGQQFFMLIRNVKENWSVANAFCNNMGGMLLIMNTNERKQAVTDEFQRQGITDLSLWIGLTDMEVEGQWYWVDGSSGQSPNFFQPDQPDNDGPGDEDCAELRPRRDFLINDNMCSRSQKSVCEFALGS